MMKDKITPEPTDNIPIRMSGIVSIFYRIGLMGRWGAWIILAISLLITFNTWYFARGEAKKRAQTRFDFQVKAIEKGIYERLLAYEFLLQGGSGLFSITNEITRDDWRTYVTRLQINQYYPGIQGVGYSKRILASDKEAHLRLIRSEGFPQYTIKPEGDRPEYTSIVFLEPFDWRNQRAFGYDMFSEPTRKEAMIRARDTGKAALSGKVTLVQETDKDKQAGFLIYQAIYRKGERIETLNQRRKALMGYVYSPFRMHDFMKGMLDEKKRYIELQIFDGDTPLEETLMYRSNNAEESLIYGKNRHFATDRIILEYASHRWLLSFASSKYFEKNISTNDTSFILLLGTTISLLLFGMVLSLTKSYNQAITLANTTADLEKANTGLRTEIIEREQAEKKIVESEKMFSAVFEQAGGYCMILQPSDSGIPTIVDANKAACKAHGYNRSEMIGRPVSDLDDEDGKRLCIERTKLIMSGKPFAIETNHVRKDGSTFPVAVYANIVRFKNNPPLIVTTEIDISDKKKQDAEKKVLEKRLQQAQKMESIGTLAGGIAHDFNNILSSIIGFTELALGRCKKCSEIEDDLQEVLMAGLRAKDLVKQILTFARQSDESIKPIHINIIAKEVLKLIKSSIPTTIKINDNINSDSLVMGSPIQIHQVLMNLCTNAAYAMEENGGVLDVSVKDTAIDKMAKVPDLKHGEYIEVTVTDTGKGIPPQHIQSVFEPYFTTKPMGEGTGMGLAVVHGIIESHNGKITVDSITGKGTAFSVYLPITKKRETHTSYEKEVLPLGNENILFVDDEAPIAKMGSKMIEQLGYKVTTRTSSVEALELFRSKSHAFDLVITDMTMPNMTGEKLAIELMKIKPDIPVILCTGYSKKISEKSAAKAGIKAFAYKPVVKADLAKTIRKVLDKTNYFE